MKYAHPRHPGPHPCHPGKSRDLVTKKRGGCNRRPARPSHFADRKIPAFAGMTIRVIFVFILSMVMAYPVSANEKWSRGKQEDCYTAEVLTDYLDSWNNLHLAYKQFGDCYRDGGPAEVMSEATIRLFADHWHELPALEKLADRDSLFLQFVLSHIDKTLNEDDIDKVDKLSKNSCPIHTHGICAQISDRILKLDQEIKKETP